MVKQENKIKQKKNVKKKFFEVEAPMTSTKIQLLATEPEELNGKCVRLDLTRNLRGKSFELKLKIKADGENLSAVPRDLVLAGSYIRRMMRRGTDYVEDSFVADCRDFSVRVKPFLITRKRVSRAVRNALRETAKKFIISQIKVKEANEMVTLIMTNKFQKMLSLKLKKIYPLALCEIRQFEILKEVKAKPEEVKVEVAEEVSA